MNARTFDLRMPAWRIAGLPDQAFKCLCIKMEGSELDYENRPALVTVAVKEGVKVEPAFESNSPSEEFYRISKKNVLLGHITPATLGSMDPVSGWKFWDIDWVPVIPKLDGRATMAMNEKLLRGETVSGLRPIQMGEKLSSRLERRFWAAVAEKEYWDKIEEGEEHLFEEPIMSAPVFDHEYHFDD